MTNKEYLSIAIKILNKLYSNDVSVIATIMVEDAEKKYDFTKTQIEDLKNICEKALEEINNGRKV